MLTPIPILILAAAPTGVAETQSVTANAPANPASIQSTPVSVMQPPHVATERRVSTFKSGEYLKVTITLYVAPYVDYDIDFPTQPEDIHLRSKAVALKVACECVPGYAPPACNNFSFYVKDSAIAAVYDPKPITVDEATSGSFRVTLQGADGDPYRNYRRLLRFKLCELREVSVYQIGQKPLLEHHSYSQDFAD